jgi:hypothetical protein
MIILNYRLGLPDSSKTFWKWENEKMSAGIGVGNIKMHKTVSPDKSAQPCRVGQCDQFASFSLSD